ncbi:MAG: response regulator transcription factor, partial [Chloroflexi bacterium]|nr:response regulator transcription factor [Chloroflexota bacterium]
DKAVAQQLSISPLTVRKHVASIRKKMGAQSRTEASVRALKAGLVS